MALDDPAQVWVLVEALVENDNNAALMILDDALAAEGEVSQPYRPGHMLGISSRCWMLPLLPETMGA